MLLIEDIIDTSYDWVLPIVEYGVFETFDLSEIHQIINVDFVKIRQHADFKQLIRQSQESRNQKSRNEKQKIGC